MSQWLLIPIILLSIVLYRMIKGEAIFIPLSRKTIREILKLANIRKNDVLYDLGCGTGRVVITAAREHGIKTVGIEKNSILSWLCRWNIRRNNLENMVKVIENDFFKEDLSKATVITLYLSRKLNQKLKPKLEKELKKGTRVVSADHTFEGWKEVKKIKTGHFHIHSYEIK